MIKMYEIILPNVYRWFKSFNIVIASERQQRKLAKDIIAEDLVAERGAFTFSLERGREEIREIPFVYRPNLIAAIADLVARHDRYKITCIEYIPNAYQNILCDIIGLVLA